MLMAIITFAKWWKFITKKGVTSLIFILNVQKNWIKWSQRLNLIFKNKFDIKIIYVFNVGIRGITLKTLLMKKKHFSL